MRSVNLLDLFGADLLFLCEKYQEPSAAAKIKQGDAVRQLLREKKIRETKLQPLI